MPPTDSPSTSCLPARSVSNILHSIRKHVPGWSGVSAAEFEETVITGGLTNKLYMWKKKQVDGSEDEVPHVLIRIYGEGSESFLNRGQEVKIANTISSLGVGPRIFGLFEGGRVEEFFVSRCLTTDELSLPDIMLDIASQLARLHSVEVPALSQHPVFERRLSDWLEEATAISVDDLSEEHRAIYETYPLPMLRQEAKALFDILDVTHTPVTFCHNDLQEGNILKVENAPHLKLIDFEYAAYNYRGFDLGNHFCEWAFNYTNPEFPGFSFDASKYPTDEQQTMFLEAYRAAWTVGNGHSEESIEQLKDEAQRYMLASHFLWGVWGYVQGFFSAIPFGFFQYSNCRFSEYFRMKEQILSRRSDKS
eukprot:GILJ01003634.1.p1 GENE.GILJ01003634.1~~GILJ01003634.1.p1  ORF type:complete len:390 (+),score=38.85 GILJ01003634.1:81-1172(+)